jgi:Zn-dependent M28 family amino/carboxypeptidase
MKRLALLVGVAGLTVAACASEPSPPSNEPVPGPTPSVARITLGALPDVDVDAVLAHAKQLSSDRFEGRAPGGKGEDLTVAYLVEQFRQMGLKPGNTGGTYTQKVPLVGITATGAPLVLRKGSDERRLRWKDDVVAWSRRVAPSASLDQSELIFVGYGAVAPEYGWDDFKGVDVKGKTLVMLVNDPPVPSPDDPSTLDPNTFGGRAMTYYGRWTYKFEMAAERGAAGALLIHETEAAGYPFTVVQGNLRERFDLVTKDKNMGRAAIEGWITRDQGRRLLEWAGQDFDDLKTRAATREFAPVPLGITASLMLENTRRTLDSRNVIARLDGRDPASRSEYVVYTAHWDHLGIERDPAGDRIYHGAKDNAVGVGGLLEIARAFTKLRVKPKRTILFLATTAEEQGLLGSEYYARMPIYPLAKTLANVNIDGLNVHGRTRDLTVIGLGASDLDDYARDAAGEQGRVIRGDVEPEKGSYYRSDHFNFAKQGVPALHGDEGDEFIGKPSDFSQKVRAAWTQRDYHQPSDVVRPEWNLSGAREDLKVYLAVGFRVAEADAYPEWKPGNEFRARREAMLAR